MNEFCNVNSISTDSILSICDNCECRDVQENMVEIDNEIFCEECAKYLAERLDNE